MMVCQLTGRETIDMIHPRHVLFAINIIVSLSLSPSIANSQILKLDPAAADRSMTPDGNIQVATSLTYLCLVFA
jgi:hypothetical protein